MTDQMLKEQVLDILESRASTYDFLSHVYRQEVRAPFLSELAGQFAPQPAEDQEDEPDGEGFQALRRYLAGMDGPEAAAAELASEYAGLFLSIGRKPCYPFESVYTSAEQLLMQKARDEVLADYRREGLDRAGEFREPEDHIAVEFEFMAYLCRQSAEAVQEDCPAEARSYLDKQRSFLDKHLLAWVPRFCADVVRTARSDFYRGVALVTAEHLSLEAGTVQDLLAAIA